MDMVAQWIDTSIAGITDQLFISWKGTVLLRNDDWDRWSRDIWYKFGEEENFEQALEYALQNQEGMAFQLISLNLNSVGYVQITFTSQGN
jgi:hypothetical protein